LNASQNALRGKKGGADGFRKPRGGIRAKKMNKPLCEACDGLAFEIQEALLGLKSGIELVGWAVRFLRKGGDE
jgi:hypothetical protein